MGLVVLSVPKTNALPLKKSGCEATFLLGNLFSGAMSVLGRVSISTILKLTKETQNQRGRTSIGHKKVRIQRIETH